MRNLLIGLLLSGLIGGCVDPKESPVPIEGSTYRIDEYKPSDKSEVTLRIMRDRKDCAGDLQLGGTELEKCIPAVDRASGQTRLSFAFQDKTTGNRVYLPLTKEQIQVSLNSRPITSPNDYDLV